MSAAVLDAMTTPLGGVAADVRILRAENKQFNTTVGLVFDPIHVELRRRATTSSRPVTQPNSDAPSLLSGTAMRHRVEVPRSRVANPQDQAGRA